MVTGTYLTDFQIVLWGDTQTMEGMSHPSAAPTTQGKKRTMNLINIYTRQKSKWKPIHQLMQIQVIRVMPLCPLNLSIENN